jgi:hypothetical protein
MSPEEFEEIPISPAEEKEETKEEVEKVETEREEIEKAPEEEKESEIERAVELERIRKEIKEIEEKEKEKEFELEEEKEREIKSELIKESVEIPEKYRKLIGNDSEEAWGKREELEEKGDFKTLAKSLAGVASEKSREWLDKNKENQSLWGSICEGLKGDDSEKAHQIREYLYFDKNVNRIRGGMTRRIEKFFGLHKSEIYYKIRKTIDKRWPIGYFNQGNLAESLLGCKSEKAKEWRMKLKDDAPAEVLISLAGIDEPWANEIREEYEGDKRLRWAYQKSLIGIKKERK